jgi:hypothetical protein
VLDLKLRRIAPIGTHQSLSGHELDTYPVNQNAESLRALRGRLGMPLRLAAATLGLPAIIYGELERGHFDCDWELAERTLRDEGERD